jgi:polyhydroxyalkanoate synthesis regulator phasin
MLSAMPKLPSWDDVKRVADDVEKKVQSAGATAREKWNQQVRPKLAEIQKKVEATGQRAGDSLQNQLIALNDALGKLQHEIAEDLKIGRKPPEAKPETDPKPKGD